MTTPSRFGDGGNNEQGSGGQGGQGGQPIIEALTTGRVTHDYPITIEEATEMGLPVTVGLPRSIYDLMDLYPQPQGGRPAVQFYPRLKADP
jgi:ClpP class serine protease